MGLWVVTIVEDDGIVWTSSVHETFRECFAWAYNHRAYPSILTAVPVTMGE